MNLIKVCLPDPAFHWSSTSLSYLLAKRKSYPTYSCGKGTPLDTMSRLLCVQCFHYGRCDRAAGKRAMPSSTTSCFNFPILHFFERSIYIIRWRMACRTNGHRTGTCQRDPWRVSSVPVREPSQKEYRSDDQNEDKCNTTVPACADRLAGA